MFNNILHNSTNLRIVIALIKNRYIPIKNLEETLYLSKEDILQHVNQLNALKYILVKNKKIKLNHNTRIFLSKRGRKALNNYINSLEDFIKNCKF